MKKTTKRDHSASRVNITARLTSALLLLCLVSRSQMQPLISSLATCGNEGEEIHVPNISNECIRCFCRNTLIECTQLECRSLDGCHVVLHDRPPSACCRVCKGCTFRGQLYRSGSQWVSDVDPCVHYHCQAAVLTRSVTKCVITCSHPIIVPNHCCPHCPGCELEGRSVNEGVTVSLTSDPCTTCTCAAGRLRCTRSACPVLNCLAVFHRTRPGQCCPVCTGSRTVFDVSVYGRCYFRRQVLPSGELVHSARDDCTRCVCTNGTTYCKRRVCPVLDCAAHAPNDTMTSSNDVTTPRCCRSCGKRKRRCAHASARYKHGDVWRLDVCTHCRCDDGVTYCHVERCTVVHAPCPKNYEFKVVNGKCCPECVEAAGVCVVFGDPHYRTFDARTFTFQGPCRYLLAAAGTRWCGPLTAGDGDIAARIPGVFSVRASNAARGATSEYTWTRRVTVTLGDFGVRIDLLQRRRVRVNRRPVELPYTDPVGGRYSIHEHSFTTSSYQVVRLKTSLGVQVIWDGSSYLELSVPATFRRAVCGLCGNFNGRESDDVLGRDGRRYLDVEQLGASWTLNADCDRHDGPRRRSSSRVVAKTSHGRPACVQRASLDDIRHRCSVLKSSMFLRCRRRVDVTHYYQSCVMDSCQCPAGDNCTCQVITAYLRACQRAGIRRVPSNVTSLCHRMTSNTTS